MKAVFKDLWQRINLTKNTTQKLFSLIFALVFWIFVMDTDNPEMTKLMTGIPVTVLGEQVLVQKELQIMQDQTPNINVKVRGRRKDVLSLSSSDIEVTVDLSSAKAGKHTYPIKVAIQRAGVVIDSVSLSALNVEIEQVLKAKRPIDVALVGTVPEPFVVALETISEGLVEIQGPESLVNQVTRLKGQVDVTGVTASFSTEVGLLPMDSQGLPVEGVTLSKQKMRVAIKVLERRQMPLALVTEGALAEGLALKGAKLVPESITVVGDSTVLDLIKAIPIQAVQLGTITESTTQPVILMLPEGIRTEIQQIVQLEIDIEKRARRIFTVPTASINLMNAQPDTKVTFTEAEVDIMIEGPESVLSALDGDQLKLSLDIINLSQGRHRVAFMVDVPEGFQWIEAEGGESRLELIIEGSTSGDE